MHISEPLSPIEVLALACGAQSGSSIIANITTELGTFVVMEQSVVDFLEDCSMYTADNLDILSPEERKEVCTIIGTMFLTAFTKIRQLKAERDSSNSKSSHQLPAILPFQVVALKPRDFFSIVKQQKQRLLQTWSEQDLSKLEDQFRSFKEHVSNSTGSQAEIEKYSSCSVEGAGVFQKSWSTFCTRFPLLVQFFGGLGSVFPGTSSVESDFSILQWEKDEHRAHLTNLSLEGVLQCKQSHDLLKIYH